ncbi:hypothetical protein SAZ11_22065 [Streptomyces sp. FXJ1.4098]|uniref:hypothetical protein n=1 Tax=Streptomyces sp. NPDC020845 TaxID=3365096 RepID=UPI002997EB75|nr:hypothetical protein [Streptomyces sp. FXJ1.4098]
MPFDAPPGWPPTPAFLRLYVEDAEATHRRAVAAGGTSVTEVTHLFFGDPKWTEAMAYVQGAGFFPETSALGG